MFYCPKKSNSTKGQSFIDIIIALAILTILSYALFTLVISSYQTISFTRSKVTAKHIAQDKIETIRNLPFSDIGTIGGIPTGILAQNEVVIRNGLNYDIKTSVVYIDDPFDGTSPTDLLPIDYKRVRVDVSWKGIAASRNNPLTLISDIAPKGVETTIGGGTLSILVFDANAQPVPQADVSIAADMLVPPVNLNLQTNINGRIVLPGAPSCTDCYKITVTKSGFSTDRTYSSSEVANPNKPDVTILDAQLTEISFAVDKVSSLNISSVGDESLNFAPLPYQSFYLKGSKTIGTDINDFPVYKYSQLLGTNDSGNITIPDLEWDNYFLIPENGNSYDLAASNPLIPLSLLPNTSQNLSFALTPHTSHNLLTAFVDNSQNPIASVSAELSDSIGFIASSSSGVDGKPNFGQIFLPNLSPQSYSLNATASGYSTFSGNISVNGQTQQIIIMN